MRRDGKPTRCHWMLYCTYDMLNMFRELLCPTSGAQDYIHDCVVQHPSYWTHSLLPCIWPPTTSNQALHTIGGNNTHIASSSWWWVQKCPKHVELIISAINHSVTSSWFFFCMHMERCTDRHTSILQCSKAAYSIQFNIFNPYKDYKNSQYINIYNKIQYTNILW
jgi:hypothetical protein